MIPFRPHRFARSRRFPPPIALLAQGFAPLLAQDSRACCIPLPILGFAAFLSTLGWLRLPTLAISGRCAAGHASDASPQRGSYPSEDSPRPQPCRVATIVASLVFASRAASIDASSPLPASTFVSGLHEASPSRRCSADGSVPAHAVSSAFPAYPPWALVPFEVLRSRTKSLFVRGRSSSLRPKPKSERASLRSACWLRHTRPTFRLGNHAPAMVARGSSRRAVRRAVTVKQQGPRTQAPFDTCARIPRGSVRCALQSSGEVAFQTALLAEDGRRWPRSTFTAGWVTCATWMMERSDLIPLELAFERRFSRHPTMVGHRCR